MPSLFINLKACSKKKGYFPFAASIKTISYLLFSAGGAYLSLICMYFASKVKGFSLIGVSIIGAIGHNVGQLLVASLIVENINMVGYLPFMLMTSLITGMFVGLVSKYCCPKMEKFSKKH